METPLHTTMQLSILDLLDVYRKRTEWWAWLAILTLQLEHADAVERQDFWHMGVYHFAIKDAIGILKGETT